MIDRAALVSTTTNAAQVLLEADFVLDDVERAQPFGLTSMPPAGATCVVASVDEDHPIVIQTGDARFTLAGVPSGGVALHDQAGNRVLLNNDGTIEIIGSVSLTVNAPTVTIVADTTLQLGTDGTPEPAVLGDKLIHWLENHHHNNSGAPPDLIAMPTTGIRSATVTVQP